jgi:hypothetical protein
LAKGIVIGGHMIERWMGLYHNKKHITTPISGVVILRHDREVGFESIIFEVSPKYESANVEYQI